MGRISMVPKRAPGKIRSGNADRLIQIFGIDQVIAAQLLTRFCKRAVRYQAFPLADADAGCSCSRMQR